jgi:diaminopimelate decarboxylase/aspartate kinase
VLLTFATQVVAKQGITRVGLDAGMQTLARPALYDAWHDVVNLSKLALDADASFDIVGPICESSDVLGRRRPLPASTAAGDVMLIADAGAYGYVMASHYNLRGLPKEEVLDV